MKKLQIWRSHLTFSLGVVSNVKPMFSEKNGQKGCKKIRWVIEQSQFRHRVYPFLLDT